MSLHRFQNGFDNRFSAHRELASRHVIRNASSSAVDDVDADTDASVI